MKDGEKMGNFKNYDSRDTCCSKDIFRMENFTVRICLLYRWIRSSSLHYLEGAKTGTNYEYFASGKVKTKESVASNGIDTHEESFTEDGKTVYEKNFQETETTRHVDILCRRR